MQHRRLGAANRRDRFLVRAVLVACSLYVGVNMVRLAMQEGRLIEQGRILGKDRQVQDSLRQRLLTEIADARSTTGVEHLARKDLALARPREVSVVFLEGAKPRLAPYPVPPTPAPSPAASPQSKP